jgi:hypothetical protein
MHHEISVGFAIGAKLYRWPAQFPGDLAPVASKSE